MYVFCVSIILMWSCACHCVGGRGEDETDGHSEKSKKTRRPAPEGRYVHIYSTSPLFLW